MSTQPSPIQQNAPQTLSQRVRAKYPGAYDDLDDSTLEQKVLAKYPEYGDLPRTQPQPAQAPVQKPAPGQPITPLPGESFEQTMQRGIAGGRAMTQGDINTAQTALFKAAPSQIPAALAAGPALAATQFGAAAIPSAVGTAVAARPWWLGGTAAAAKGFQETAKAASGKAVEITDELSGALSKYQQLVDAGGSRSMSVSKFLNRVTDPEKEPLTYEEARNFYSNISRLSRDEFGRLTPVMRNAVGNVRVALNSAIQNTAAGVGKGAEFAGAMKDYARAAQLRQFGGNTLERYLPWLARGAAGAAGYQAYKTIFGK